MEMIVFVLSIFLTLQFFYKWYYRVYKIWDIGNYRFVKRLFYLTPVILLVIYFYTTTSFAASDVVTSQFYIFYYIVLGFAFTNLTNHLIFMFLNISWIDDALNSNNKATALTVSGVMIGLGLIYSFANVGEGPGFWTVIVASSLGLIAFILLIMILNKTTKILDKIISDHNLSLAIRFSMLVLGLSLILGKAASGNWTSLKHTFVEFLIFWPAIILIIISIVIELIFKNSTSKTLSFTIGLVYLGFSVISLLYLTDLFDFVKLLM